MSNKTPRYPLSPADIKKLAKKIIAENPIYMPDEPEVVGSPENLVENIEEFEDAKPTTQESQRSKK